MAQKQDTSSTGAVPGALFKGGPFTKIEHGSNGASQITVVPSGIGPFAVRCANWIAGLSGLTSCGGGLYAMIYANNYTKEAFGVVAGLSLLTIPLAGVATRLLSSKKASVTFTATHIEINKLTGTRRFERAHPHAFVLLPHDKTKLEEERHAFLVRKRPPKWWSPQRKKYYGKSFHVVLTYLGERHDILTVYGRKRATKIQSRLQACDVVMSGIDFGNSGTALSPKRDWATDAGGL